MAAYMVEQGFLTKEQIEEIGAEAKRAIDEATDVADAAEPPDPSTIYDNLFVD